MPAITFAANVQDVTVPTVLVAGTLDAATFKVSLDTFDMIGSTDKEFVPIENAKHLHFDSGRCAQTQSRSHCCGEPACNP